MIMITAAIMIIRTTTRTITRTAMIIHMITTMAAGIITTTDSVDTCLPEPQG